VERQGDIMTWKKFFLTLERICLIITVGSIFIAVIFFFLERNDRRKSKHYQAWQVINSAKGHLSNGGRIDALQDLAEDNISLAGVDLSNAYLYRLKLKKGASLYGANLAGANLFEASLADVYFADANLFKTSLNYSNLQRARFMGANLGEATLFKVNLSKADLNGANLSSAILWGADLSGADLFNAILVGADLLEVDLSGASLLDIKGWKKIKSINSTNIYGIEYPPDGFIEWAKEHGAVSFKNKIEWEEFIEKNKKRK